MRQPKTLKYLLKKNILLITVIPTIIFTILSTAFVLNFIKKNEDHQQNMVLDMIESEMKKMLDSNLFVLTEVDATLEGRLIEDDKVNQYLEGIISRYELFDSIRIVDREGNVVHAPTSEEDIIGFNVAYQDYFQSALNSTDSYWSKVFMSAESSMATIAISMNTKDDEMIIGYCSLSAIQKIVDEIQKEPLHNIAVVEGHGAFIAHSDFNKVTARESELNYDKLKVNGTYVIDHNNEKFSASSRTFINNDFTIIFYKPLFESYSIVGYLLLISLSFIILVFILSILIANIQTKPIIDTISELIEHSGEISQGNYDITLEHAGIEEFNELKNNFNSMSMMVQEMFNRLSESQMELEILNEDLCQQNEEIKKSEEQISVIINSTYDGILVLDTKYNVLWVNNAVYELFDIDKKHFMRNTKCYDLLYGFHSKCYHCDMEVVKLSRDKLSKIISYDKKLIEETYIPNYDDQGEFLGVIKTFRDITDKVALETKLNRAIKMEAIGRLTGGIAHDFNNILQVIIGYTDLVMVQMQQSEESESVQSKMRTIYEAANKAERLIKKLMTFSKIEQISPKSINLNIIVRELGTMLSRIIGDDIVLSLRLEEMLPEVFADPTQFEQIIMNLCINAKHAMPNGGSIDIHTYSIEKNSMTYVALEVTDTGTGISEGIKEKIFDPFFTTKDIGKGTGLGLAIVLGIVEKHHGFIELNTTEGVGTTFTIFIPSTHIQSMIQQRDDFDIDDTKLKGIHILFAEDDDSVRTIAASVLKGKGIHLIEAVDGRDALKKYMDIGEKVDLLILDVIMPGINGVEVFESIKSINPNIKTIFTTGYSNDFLGEDYNLFLQGKVLQKPYRNEELIRSILEVLEE
jgi:signal transduction histidine kinase/HAMP domain-containing protein